jgi:hypothetical protein
VVIEAEMPQRQPAVLRSARDALRDNVDIHVELVPKEPGSLPRTMPKLTISNS